MVAALAVVLIAAALGSRNDGTDAGAAPTTTPTTACAGLPYQPCGGAPAPNTDGSACLANFYDVDQDPANGCEVRGDGLNGTTFDRPITANLVPADAVDRYPFRVEHDSNPITGIIGNPLCDNVLAGHPHRPAGGIHAHRGPRPDRRTGARLGRQHRRRGRHRPASRSPAASSTTPISTWWPR